jgi:uncharacterized membrane protein YhaH (DUF805 family)
MGWYLMALRRAFDFRGRSRRKEFWTFYLTNIGIWIGFGVVGLLNGEDGSELDGWGMAGGVFMLALLIPMLAASVRRLHDTGRTGAWVFINLIPLLGWITLLIFQAQPGQSRSNPWGADPRLASD